MKMVKIVTLISVLANCGWACSDFSGTWKGTCTGPESTPGMHSVVFRQKGCEEISYVENNVSVAIKADNMEHEIPYGTFLESFYLAKFETRVKPNDTLSVHMFDKTSGSDIEDMLFNESANGERNLTWKADGIYEGPPEFPLEGKMINLFTCTYRWKK